ncbi:hypothetical protein ONS96_007206 [Cadophora gregata f. sp. sojae]|nr:hypothetical protein ONS96_007206 [Cadophora gregata f. sp. sojae]
MHSVKMCQSSNYGSSPDAQKVQKTDDICNMAKQIIHDAKMDLQRILNNATSTTTSEPTAGKRAGKLTSRDTEHLTIKQKLINGFAKIISVAESITGIRRVTQEPNTVFFLKKQSPTAHLSILRNPTRAYERATPAFSPALGHASDAYIRLNQRQYQQDRITVENGDYMETIKNTAHRMAQVKRYKQAKKSLSQIQQDHDAWVYDKHTVDVLCEKIHKDALFWRSCHEDTITVVNQDGTKEEQWYQNDQDRCLGSSIEDQMQMQGRSIKEWAGLRKAVEDLEQEARHERMVKHREQWRQTKYVPEEYNSDTDDSDMEEDDDEDYGHLYDDVDVAQVRISEVVAKDEAITTSPASSSGIPQIKSANLEEHLEILDYHTPTLKTHLDNIVETKTTQTNFTTNQASSEMALTTTKTTKEVVTETDAVISLVDTLLSDLKDRYEFYYTSSNVHMNNVLEAMRPRTLGYKCSWTVRPMAMTEKNLTPPPVNQPPAIRLTNPSGVTCELIEGFQDLSDPWFEDYVAWREEEQDDLIQAVQEWREKEETFDEYDRRLVCEEFWDKCLEKDLKRIMQERKKWEDMDVVFEDDSEDSDDDDDDWDEYSCSRSRSSSSTTLVPDQEETGVETGAQEEEDEDEDEDEEEEPETNTETEILTALEVARTNLAEYNTSLANSVVIAKTKAINYHLERVHDSPQHNKATEDAQAVKDSYTHNLSYSIIRLRLRMAQDGLIPSDKSNFVYTPTKPTGPGTITFTGRIREFLKINKDVHDRAFSVLREDIRVQAIHKMDFFKEVKVSMAHVADLYRDVKNAKVFRKEVKRANKQMEVQSTVVSALVHEGVAEAEKWEKEEKEEKEKEKEKKMAGEVVKKGRARPVEKEDLLVVLGTMGDMMGVEVGGKKAGAKAGKSGDKGKGKGKDKGKGKGKGNGKGKGKGRRKGKGKWRK